MMRLRSCALLLLAVVGLCGCGSTWTARRAAADGSYFLATAAYALVQVQVATGTIPDDMTPEEFAAEVAKANAGYVLVQQGYATCLLAIEAQDSATYTTGLTQLGLGTAAVLAVKSSICPFIGQQKDK